VAGEITAMPKSFLITNKRYITTAIAITTSTALTTVSSGVSSVSSVAGLSASLPSQQRTTPDNEEHHETSALRSGIDEETGKHSHRCRY